MILPSSVIIYLKASINPLYFSIYWVANLVATTSNGLLTINPTIPPIAIALYF